MLNPDSCLTWASRGLRLRLALLLLLFLPASADRNVLLGSTNEFSHSLSPSSEGHNSHSHSDVSVANVAAGGEVAAAHFGRNLLSALKLTSLTETASKSLHNSSHTASLEVNSEQKFLPLVPGLGIGKDILKACAILAILAIAWRACTSACSGKRCDCRRFKPLGKLLLSTGIDEFPAFDMVVSVHSVQDVKKDGLFGKKEFKVKINMNWSAVETSGTKDMRWEQTKKLEVPQGATECSIALYSLGKLMDSQVAEIILETKRDMLDKENFWGQKQKFKLESKGSNVGTLLITFRKKGDEGADSMFDLPIDGVDETSALAVDLAEALQELEKTPGFVKPKGKMTGELKIALLAKVLKGPLREVNLQGKETGQTYVKVLQCNFAELKGDDMAEELKYQKEKAKKKGLSAPERKWYWVWYPDKKVAEHDKDWHYPDGFIPIASITSVHRSPERDDQFVIKYTGAGGKEVLIYRRDAGKSLDAWVEGLELCFGECRKMIKDKDESKTRVLDALPRMRAMHASWVKQNGMPDNEQQWTQWFQWLRQNNFEDDLIRRLYVEIAGLPTKSTAASAPAAGTATATAAGTATAKAGPPTGTATAKAAPKASPKAPATPR